MAFERLGGFLGKLGDVFNISSYNNNDGKIAVKVDKVIPEAPRVNPTQDAVKAPAPITPTELVLAKQAVCGGSIKTQDINIEIINEINIANGIVIPCMPKILLLKIAERY